MHWIVVEDSNTTTELVSRFLARTSVAMTSHLHTRTPPEMRLQICTTIDRTRGCPDGSLGKVRARAALFFRDLASAAGAPGASDGARRTPPLTGCPSLSSRNLGAVHGVWLRGTPRSVSCTHYCHGGDMSKVAAAGAQPHLHGGGGYR